MDKRQHIHYFDYLRIFAMLAVVFMHSASAPLRAELNLGWHFLNLFTSLAFTAVPLFLMMSGHLLLSNERTADIQILLRKRLPRLLFPLMFWTLVSAVWLTYRNGNFSFHALINMLVDALDQPVISHFWYMYTLIAIYLISPLLYHGLKGLDRKGHILIFTLAALVSVQTMLRQLLPVSLERFVNFDTINKMSFFGGHLCTFILGYYLGGSKRYVPNALLIALTLLCLGGITCGTYILSKLHGAYDQTFLNQSSGFEILLASCVFLLCKQNLNRTSEAVLRVTRPVVALSLPIYLMHPIVLSVFSYFGYYSNGFLGALFTTAAVLFICLIVIITLATLRPLCFISIGLNYSDANSTCSWRGLFRTEKSK